ncbi:MAG: trypsin-like peptidase domain-containing protein [Candidatus Bathyarchaeota archaeon]|jgi:S1-C subfamily serine protease
MEEQRSRFSASFMILLILVGLIVGGIASYYLTFTQIQVLREDISNLKSNLSDLAKIRPNITYQNITLFQNGTALAELYQEVRDSVVLVFGETGAGGSVQGSGFVYNFSGSMFVITNYHVIHDTRSRSVTFSNGRGYAAHINGKDPYADLAVLTVDAPDHEFKPLEIVGSSGLVVGDPVIAIGNPYGLVGSMTTGLVSALGRTITEEEFTGGYGIANIIQTSTPINPGNSGGPLLNWLGKVVGITTAIIEDSQGLGFAVPSNTILREIYALIKDGTFDGHSHLGLQGQNMNYEVAQEMGIELTYGWRIVGFTDPSPSMGSGIETNDIIVAMNNTSIKNSDELASYLEEYTIPGETIILEVKRPSDQGLETHEIPVTLGKRPPPPV